MEDNKISRDIRKTANKVLLIEGLVILLTVVPGNYLSYILTDVVGISVVKVSSMVSIGAVVATISIFVLGAMANFTNTKWGQFRPWLVALTISAIVAAFLITVNFGHSGIGLVMVVIGVILFNIANTMMGMARTGCFMKMSKGNAVARNLFGARDWAGVCFGSIIGGFAILPLVKLLTIGDNATTGWVLLQVIFSACGIAGILWLLRLSKETDVQRGIDTGLTKDELKAQGLAFSWEGLWDMIKALVVNRTAITVFVSDIFGWMIIYWPMYMQAYIAQYVFNNVDLLTVYVPLAAGIGFLATFFVEKLVEIIGGRKKTVIVFTAVSLMAYLIIWLVPAVSMTQIGWILMLLINQAAISIRCSLIVMMYFDAGEYWLFEKGKDHRAFLNASQNAAITISAAICGVCLGIILTKVGYVEGAALAAEGARGLMSMFGLVGAGASLFALIPLFIHNKSDEQMVEYAVKNVESGYKSADEL